jgi:hypothetical protein
MRDSNVEASISQMEIISDMNVQGLHIIGAFVVHALPLKQVPVVTVIAVRSVQRCSKQPRMRVSVPTVTKAMAVAGRGSLITIDKGEAPSWSAPPKHWQRKQAWSVRSEGG